jgi:hypothetical protein
MLPTRKPRRLARARCCWARRFGHHAARAASGRNQGASPVLAIAPRSRERRGYRTRVTPGGADLTRRGRTEGDATGRCGEAAILGDSHRGALLAKPSMRLPVIKPGQ